MSSDKKPVIKKISVSKPDMRPASQLDFKTDLNYDAKRNVGLGEAMANNVASFNPLSKANNPDQTESSGSGSGAGGDGGGTSDTAQAASTGSAIKLIKVNKPVIKPTAVQHASKHFDVVLGIDIHWTQIPPPPSFMLIPLPLPHPFVGAVFDIMDYITINITVPAVFQKVFSSLPASIPLGGSIYVHGRHKATTTTSVVGVLIPFKHLTGTIPVYLIASPMEAPNEGEVYYGSETVLAQGSKLSGNQPQHVLTCMGFPFGRTMLPAMPDKPKKNPLAYFASYANFASMYVQINWSGPVLVGGPFVPHVYTLGEMAMRFAGMFLMKKLTKMLGTGFNKKLLQSKALQRFKLAEKLSKRLCDWGFEPVNLVSGAMMFEWDDFSIEGSTPLAWKNAWYSDQPYGHGLLGNGVFNNHDLYIIPDEEGDLAAWIHPQEYQPFAIPVPVVGGDRTYFREQKIWQERPDGDSWILQQAGARYSYQRFAHPDQGDVYRVTEIRYADGALRNYRYAGDGLLAYVHDVHSDSFLALEWNAQVRKVAAVYYGYGSHRDVQVRYDHDAWGNLTHVWDRHDKAIHFEYDDLHRVVRRTNRNGMSYTWRYDSAGRVVHTTGLGGFYEGEIHYFPSLGYNEVVYVQQEQKRERYYYDEQELTYLHVDAEGGEHWRDYTDTQEVKLLGSPEGRTQGYSYDDYGYLRQYHTADGEVIDYVHDAYGRLLERRSSSGLTERWQYDGQGRLQRYSDPSGSAVQYRYHAESYQPYESMDESGLVTEYTYNDRGQLLSLRNTAGTAQQWRYDAYGRLVEFSPNPRNHNRWKRDKLGRVVLVKEAGALDLTVHYDGYDLPVHVSDGQREWLMSYTPMGSLQRQVRRDAHSHRREAVLDFTYDAYENLQSIVNEKGETYLFERDGNDAVIAETGFDGQQRQYLRDRDGLVQQQVDAGGRRTYFRYDLAGRLQHTHYPDSSWEAFQYDRSGLLIRADNADHTTVFSRNALGQVTREQQGQHSVDYRYDSTGQLLGLTSSLGAQVDYGHDAYGRLEMLTAGMQGVSGQWQLAQQHDVQGFTQRRSMTGGVSSRMSYDPTGRPTAQLVEVKDRGVQWDRSYDWSATGKLLQTLDRVGSGSVQYDYELFGSLYGARYPDGSGRLKNPDETGNLYENSRRSDRVYDKGGRLLRDTTWYYLYDDLGNVILKSKRPVQPAPAEGDQNNSQRKRSPSMWDADYRPSVYDRVLQPELSDDEGSGLADGLWQAGDWAYGWAASGMLQSVRRPDGEEVSFEYDALGRRTAKIAGAYIVRYIWDGNVLLHEWQYDLADRPSMAIDQSGGLSDGQEPISELTTWIYEPGSFSPVAKLVGEERFSIISDYLGTPVQAYNEQGEKVWERELDIYGGVRKGSNDFIPFTYPGQYYDQETGLCYNRFRYYDPDSGNFISQDPIGLEGGNPTMYGYVYDPNTEIDPFGLDLIRLRHYTSNKGFKGIKEDMIIKASDQNAVFAVRAKGKPLSMNDAAEKFKVQKNHTRNYIDFDIDDSRVEFRKNDLGVEEYKIKGDVVLDAETTTFVKRCK